MNEKLSDELLKYALENAPTDTFNYKMARELLDLRQNAETSQNHNDAVMSPLFDQMEAAGYTGTWTEKVRQACELATKGFGVYRSADAGIYGKADS